VALMGSRSQYVVSGSDEGHIFVWERGTGALVNLLRSSDAGVSCVAPHPHLPMLASCGHDPVVRLWSPEVSHPLIKCGIQVKLLTTASSLDPFVSGAVRAFK
jgi:WD40 repeat protein